VTKPELAIARSVIYAGLFDYPLSLHQLHNTLLEADLTPSEILAIYGRSVRLRRIVEYRDGYFFPIGREALIGERRLREARSRLFLRRYRHALRAIGTIPFVRMVALSGSIAHLNLERGGDLDLCIVTRGRHVWTAAVLVVLLTKMLRCRRVVCANFLLSDAKLQLDQQDLFTANQVIHLKPLVGREVLDELVAANPFVRRIYPNAQVGQSADVVEWPRHRALELAKSMLETALELPSPLVEATCRRLYSWYLRRRAALWRSPEQVRLGDELLKLHTRSHRAAVLERFDAAVEDAWQRANPDSRVAAG